MLLFTFKGDPDYDTTKPSLDYDMKSSLSLSSLFMLWGIESTNTIATSKVVSKQYCVVGLFKVVGSTSNLCYV